VEQRGRSGAKRVGDDRRQLGADVVELAEERQGSSQQTTAAGDARRRDEGEPPNARRLRPGELGRDQPAQRVADEVDPSEPRGVQQPGEPRCELTGPQPAEVGQLDEVEAQPGRKVLDDRRPPAPRAGQPMHDDDVRPRPGHPEPHRLLVERELPQLHPLILHPRTADIGQLG
jgi:hypothetical protein